MSIRKKDQSGTERITKLDKRSENEALTQSGLFKNEIGPGAFQSSVQRTQALQEC